MSNVTDGLRHVPVLFLAGHREGRLRQSLHGRGQCACRGRELACQAPGGAGPGPAADLAPNAQELPRVDAAIRGDDVGRASLQLVKPVVGGRRACCRAGLGVGRMGQSRSYRSTGRTNTVAPPTSTSSGYGRKNSPGSMIGGMGLTTCVRDLQLTEMISMTSSTADSSTPRMIVAFDCLRNPPDECRRVARYSFSR